MRGVLRLSLVLACLALSACTILPQRPPPPASHDLGLVKGKPAPAPWQHVSVSEPNWLQNEGLNYRLVFASPTRLRAYARDQWVASPGDLLSERLNSVESPTGRYVVHLNLLAFEQVFTAPGQAHAYLRAQVEADSVNGANTLTRTFVLRTPTPQANAQGAVKGLSTLTARLGKALRRWLSAQSK